MALFRQVAKGRGWLERDELLKDTSVALGFRKLGSRTKGVLQGHLRTAFRRKVVERDGDLLRVPAIEDYTLEDFRVTVCSVMPARQRCERDEVVQAVVHHLGFARVTDAIRQSVKSAINSGIRQGLLGYEGSEIWRE